MNVALPAFARCQIEFEIGIRARRGADVIERSDSQRGAPEISVQDYAGGVDERQQRVTERLAKLTFDDCKQAAERKVQRLLVQLAVADFLTEAREHDANTLGDGGMTLAFDQRLHVGLAEQFVRRRQFLKQRGFVSGGHRRRLCHSELRWSDGRLARPVPSSQKNWACTVAAGRGVS